jgi:hypothetical protein
MTEYCPKCGSKIEFVGLSPAEKWGISRFSSAAHDPYDTETGKRVYFKKYKWPKERWWNIGHEHFAIREKVLQDSPLQKAGWDTRS